MKNSPIGSWRGIVTAAALALLPLAVSPAQIPSGDKISVKVEMVNILCSVTDKKGQFVTHLKAADFTVTEDGAVQQLENFYSHGNLPLTICLLVDTSASVASKLQFEQEAASAFLASNIHEKDKALLIEFDSGVTLVQDFTNETDLIARQLKTLRAAGGTSLYDALFLVSEEKLMWDVGERRKTIIIISDGEDTVSRTPLDETLEMVQRAGAIVFAISTNRTGQTANAAEGGDSTLEKFASATGGKVYYPTRIEEVGLAFREIDQELRSQYSLSYKSSNAKRDGKFHEIKVTVKPKGMKVRHRKGYYAPKD
ncbi:MAG: VWA domain-containing protein [Acidobacteria bacterium]|nr:VWA domain-containing protein [Acidobacteriota bacterium]